MKTLKLAVLLALVTTEAAAHKWYPWQCCSNRDCMEITKDDVIEGANGITIRATGELVPWGDKRIKFTPPDDPNNGYHWCRKMAGPEKDKTICVYLPERGV